MKVVAAYLLTILGGNASLSAKDLKTVFASAILVIVGSITR
ncbi:hypothetical protein RchiOBHm_Chr3g0491861 [Rosa chinensis]|uniref:Uncharacterized protein n=1 Tax=Rosa chinensis TaxID=74649 RepID=A0A2P6RGC4_ROSCH|nr:hypothetical protein RchiOBHm_Chr3g0491861 [Rosa chinensis]